MSSPATSSVAVGSNRLQAREGGLRGWSVVAGAGIALSASTAPIVLGTAGIFMKPIGAEFGWDRGLMSLGLTVGGILMAIAIPFLGMAIDRWGVRKVVPPAIVLMAMNLVAVAFSPPVLGIYVLLVGLLGLTGAAQNPISYVKTVSQWFDRRRGLAIGLAVTGLAIGQALVPPFTQFVVTNWGWRNAYLTLAALLVFVALPAVLLLVRDPKQIIVDGDSSVPGAHTAAPGLTVREALRTRTFWIFGLSIGLVALTIQGSMIHLVPMLTDLGWTPAAAAGTLAIAGVASIVGRVGSGLLFDYFHAPYVGAVAILIGSVGTALLASGVAPLLGIAALGVAVGSETDMIAYFTARYFGLRVYAQLAGYLFAAYGIGSALGPLILGLGFDNAQTYSSTLWVFAVLLIVAMGAVLLLPRQYTFPAESSHGR